MYIYEAKNVDKCGVLPIVVYFCIQIWGQQDIFFHDNNKPINDVWSLRVVSAISFILAYFI